MKDVYPVFFTETDCCILVEIPDLKILTEGTDINNAIEKAREEIGLKCVEIENSGLEIPEPSDISNLNVSDGTFSEKGNTIISLVDIDTSIQRRKMETRTVRRNVTLPHWLNYEAERAGINVSKVLQEALISTLGLDNR